MLTRLRMVGNRLTKEPVSLGTLTGLVELKLNCWCVLSFVFVVFRCLLLFV